MQNNEWLREQIAFSIFNSSNPPHIRDAISLENINGNPEVSTPLGDGYQMSVNLGMDWLLNRDSFLKLADVAIAAFQKADEDGSAYR